MKGSSKKNTRFDNLVMAISLLCFIRQGNTQKNGFRGGAKSYGIHVEANTVGTNLHYDLPEAKVKAAGKAKQDWLVDNDNANMIAINSPVLASVTVKHPKFSSKGKWPGYKVNFKVPDGVSEIGAKKTDFIRPVLSEKRISSYASQRDPSGTGVLALGSGSGEKPLLSGDRVPGKIPFGGNEKLPESDEELVRRAIKRNSREVKDEDGSNSSSEETHESLQSTSPLQSIGGLLLPLQQLKNLHVKDPVVKKEMKQIVTQAKKVVSEAKIVLKDAANIVKKVKSLVHGGLNLHLSEIADYARNAVQDIGSGDTLLLEEGAERAKEAAVKAALRARVHARDANEAAEQAKHLALHASQVAKMSTSERNSVEAVKIAKAVERDAKEAVLSAKQARMKADLAIEQENLVKTNGRLLRKLNENLKKKLTGTNSVLQEKTPRISKNDKDAGNRRNVRNAEMNNLIRNVRLSGNSPSADADTGKKIRRRRESEYYPNVLENLLLSLGNLKNLK